MGIDRQIPNSNKRLTMKKLLIILFCVISLPGFSQVDKGTIVESGEDITGYLIDTTVVIRVKNILGKAGIKFYARNDTMKIVLDTSGYYNIMFDNDTIVWRVSNDTTYMSTNGGIVNINGLIISSSGNADTALIALDELGTAAHYADSAWVNFVKVNDTIWVPRIELGSNADNINGKITFIASDNNQCVDSINTSDQRVFADAARYNFSATIKTPEIFTEVFYVTNTGDTTAVNTWRYKLTGDDLIIERRNAGLSWIEIMRNSPD